MNNFHNQPIRRKDVGEFRKVPLEPVPGEVNNTWRMDVIDTPVPAFVRPSLGVGVRKDAGIHKRISYAEALRIAFEESA